MLSLPPSCRIWLALTPCDMRKGFHSLLAEARMRWPGGDPLSGDLYVFLGRQRTTVKVIWWSAGGISLYAKRLEKARFRLPVVKPGQTTATMAASDLAMLLDGIDWSRVRRPKLHEPARSLTDRR